jgi:hypothetical protein
MTFSAPAQSAVKPAKPAITPAQIQAAIQQGREYKSADKFFAKGLKGKRVAISRYSDVTFFNDWQKIAMDSAEANQQLRELKPEDVRTSGLLHAYVVIRVTLAFRSVNWSDMATADGLLRRSNLVIVINGNAVQPVARRIVNNHGTTLLLAFDFDVSPDDLTAPVTIISIDGDDGRRHQKKIELAGILDID